MPKSIVKQRYLVEQGFLHYTFYLSSPPVDIASITLMGTKVSGFNVKHLKFCCHECFNLQCKFLNRKRKFAALYSKSYANYAKWKW
ncbi:hypothetical protein GDO81_024086 [Engystomops pustulosus]|uniref:Uncharacterized protein n=1 Tax=Engystomops pustulosus TaxID=76066 RepID=A0AAV6YJQ8_ENGPU|nr:hypothetical protein GDO81_024086 [Engystomops pustulosus]